MRSSRRALPGDPGGIVPHPASVAELHPIAGVRAITVDGLPLIVPVPWAPRTFLATARGSWGLLPRRGMGDSPA